MKKTTKLLGTIIAMATLLTSCATDLPSDKQDPTKPNTPAEEPSTNGLGISDAKYESSIKISLKSAGNNYLLKNALEKLKAGEEDVYVAALGGSVTEGAGPAKFTDGYAYQFATMLKATYAKDSQKVHFDGAGIGGTPSPMGLIRYQKDVVDVLGTNPDILIIEFAVNDWQECSNTRAFEYLIRTCLEKNTAVIALYAAATYGNQQGVMSPVAKYYNIPEVSVSDALSYSGINAQKDSGIYYTDTVHPTKEGHKFMADCIMNLLAKTDEAELDEPFEIPAEYKNKNAFESFNSIFGNTTDSNVEISAGSFSKKDATIQNYSKGGKCFPENWYNDGTGTDPFTMNLNCKSLIVIFKNSNTKTFGKAIVSIDGKETKVLDGCDGSGWNNCSVVMILDEETSAKHTVEIKNEDGKAFTILAFGYSS